MNNKLSMMKLAKHIIAIAQEYNLSISNLKLQKILYFIIKDIKNCSENWNFNLTEIYNEKFELWSFGPTIPSIYKYFSKFGSCSIAEYSNRYYRKSEFDLLNNLILDYLNVNTIELVKRSLENEYYQNNKSKIKGYKSSIQYKLENIC